MSELDQIKDYVDAITKLLSQLEQAALHDAVTVSNWDHDSAYYDSCTIPEEFLELKHELDDSYQPSQITESILKLEGPLGKQIEKSHDELYPVCLSSYPSLVDAMERITASATRKAALRLRELAKEGRVSHNVRELFWDVTNLDPTDYDVDSDGQPVQVKCSFHWCFPGNPDWQGELGTALSAIEKRIPKLEALAPTTGTPKTEQARYSVNGQHELTTHWQDKWYTFKGKGAGVAQVLFDLKAEGKLPAGNKVVIAEVDKRFPDLGVYKSQNIANIFGEHYAIKNGLIVNKNGLWDVSE